LIGHCSTDVQVGSSG